MSKDSIVSRFSPADSSIEGLLTKLGVAWVGFFAGVQLTDLFTLASLIWVLLNIYVILRDRVFSKPPVKSLDSDSKGE